MSQSSRTKIIIWQDVYKRQRCGSHTKRDQTFSSLVGECGAGCEPGSDFRPDLGLSLIHIYPLDILAYQYDLVCNGVELSSGAVRNHDPEIMIKAFELVGLGEDDPTPFSRTSLMILRTQRNW